MGQTRRGGTLLGSSSRQAGARPDFPGTGDQQFLSDFGQRHPEDVAHGTDGQDPVQRIGGIAGGGASGEGRTKWLPSAITPCLATALGMM